jgi:hypothetical protein
MFPKAAIAVCLSFSPLAARVPVRSLVLSGQPVPDESGHVFQFFRDVQIDNSGDVIFRAELPHLQPDQPGATSFDLFGIENSTLVTVARAGRLAPGVSPPTPILHVDATKTEGGAIQSVLLQPGLENPSDFAYYAGPLSSPMLVFRNKTPVEEPGGAIYRHIDGLRQNRNGQFVFNANLDSDVNHDMALAIGTAGNFRVFARTGQPAPGLSAEFTYGPSEHFSSATFFDPLIDDAGRVAYAGFLAGPDVERSNEGALWFGSPDNPQLILRSGTPIAPGSSQKFLDFVPLHLSPSGKLLFTAGITSGDMDPGSDAALYVVDQDGPEFVARNNQLAPGVESAQIYRIHSVDMNDSGEVSFIADFGPVPDETTGSAVYAGTAGNIRPIAVHGQTAPNTFGDLFRAFGPSDINDRGQVAFTAGLTGSTGANGFSGGLYATDLNGSLVHVIHIGELFELAPGDVRTVVNFEAGNFNNAGELVFQATFADGTYGIFAAVIPEPSVGLIVLFSIALGRRSRFRQA